MLVFSLMLSDVDGKTYEYGMLRALGFKKPYLVTMITISSFSFSIPGCICGIFVAFVINTGLREMIYLEAKNELDYKLSVFAIILGLICGILMPFIANYYPIKSALDKNLRSSLDLNRRADKIGVKVTKLTELGMSSNQLLVSVMLFIIGFGTFYFIPYSFVKGEMTLFFEILACIMILIVLGFTFLSTLLFAAFEKLILWCTLHTCCRRDKHLYKIVVKNMEAHASRNIKTSIMFNIAVSFLIFASSLF